MIRIQTYNSDPRRVQAGGIRPGADLPAVRDVTGTAGGRTLDALLKAGGQLTDLAIREYVKDETARVSESLQMMNAELAAERDRYMRENQGRNALNAGEHFGKFAAARARELQREGGFEGRFAEQFRQQAMGNVIHFTEQGQAYARQQRAAWDQSVQEGARADFLNQVAQNFDNRDWIEFNLQKFAEDTEAMRPGLDNRAYLDKVRKETAEIIVDGFLGVNRIGDARGAFAQYRDLLGDRANAVKVRIDARADALRAKAEADRKRAEAERLVSLGAGVWADTEGLPWEEREEKALELIAARTKDPKERRELLDLFASNMKFQKMQEEARDNRQVRDLVEEARKAGLTPTQFLERLNANTETTEKVRSLAWEIYQGKIEETPANRTALVEFRAEMDRRKRDGDPVSDAEIEAWGLNSRATNAQIKEAYSYRDGGGKLGSVTASKLHKLWENLTGSKAPKDIDLYQMVSDMVPDGQKVTDRDLEAIISRLVMKGEIKGGGWGYGEDMRNYEALQSGKMATWLPSDVSGEERKEGKEFLEARNWPVTEETLRVYAKVRRGIPHNAISSLADWPVRPSETNDGGAGGAAGDAAPVSSSVKAESSPVPEPSSPTNAAPATRAQQEAARRREARARQEERARQAEAELEEANRARRGNGDLAPHPIPEALKDLPSGVSSMKHDYVVVFGEMPPSGMSEDEMKSAILERIDEDLDTSIFDGEHDRRTRARRLTYLKQNLRSDLRLHGNRVRDWK